MAKKYVNAMAKLGESSLSRRKGAPRSRAAVAACETLESRRLLAGDAPFVESLYPGSGDWIFETFATIEVVFSEPVVGFDAADITLWGDAVEMAVITSPYETGPNTWQFEIAGLNEGDLYLGIEPDPGGLTDVDGNDLVHHSTNYYVSLWGIRGHVFADLNANGVADPGESGLSGVTVYADLNGNGVHDAFGQPWAITDAAGVYNLQPPESGGYVIRIVPPADSTQIHPSLARPSARIDLMSPSNWSGVTGPAHYSAISGDGRYVVFSSSDGGLTDDNNDSSDVFVYDRTQDYEPRRISVDVNGIEVDGDSGLDSPPAISADGQVVAFDSWATGLVPLDLNGMADIFVVEVNTGHIERVSVGAGGIEANGMSIAPALSADGRYVAFASLASNLVADDDNDDWDVFVFDRQTGTIERISSDASGYAAGGHWPSISADGRFVAFESSGVIIAGDANGASDIHVYDRDLGIMERISRGYDGAEADGPSARPSISGSGRFVAFESVAGNITDDALGSGVFVFDRLSLAAQRVNVSIDGSAATGSHGPSISADGRFVAFYSLAENLVQGDANGMDDIFVRDLWFGLTMRLSAAGAVSGANDVRPAMSADGRFVAFTSENTWSDEDWDGDVSDAYVSNNPLAAPDAHVVFMARWPLTNNVDFALAGDLVPGASIRGVVYNDRNSNYMQDLDEPGLADIQVYLDMNDNWWPDEGEPSTFTALDGSYAFYGLEAGSYTVRVLTEDEWGTTEGWYPALELAQDEAADWVNFGLFEYARIEGEVYEDLNGNGVRDPGEPGLPGQVVFIDYERDGELSQYDGRAVTRWDGSFSLRYIWPGDYAVGILAPEGWTQTSPSGFHETSVAEGEVSGGLAFGVSPPAPSSIGGIVFDDANGNGTRDAGEGPLAGVRVYLDLNANARWDGAEPSVLSGPDGAFEFSGLRAGNYIVRQVTPEGAVQTWPVSGNGGFAISRISNAPDGSPANSDSSRPAFSADGRYVVFASYASNLVPGDTNQTQDIFLFDRVTGLTERISKGHDGSESNAYSGYPAISGNGRFVSYSTWASNIVPGDTNFNYDVFVYDRQTGLTERVSVAADGTQAQGGSYGSSLSYDGRFVVFESGASNLVPGVTGSNIYVVDRLSGDIEAVGIAHDGSMPNGSTYLPYYGAHSISADGNIVMFLSDATNLVPDDNNGVTDVFVFNRATGDVTRVSTAEDGTEANGSSYDPSLSANGRLVIFASNASNLVAGDEDNYTDLFVRDLVTGGVVSVTLPLPAEEWGAYYATPSLSGDGRFVAFVSYSPLLVPGDTNGQIDVFVLDRTTGQVARLNVSATGGQADEYTWGTHISDDGRFVAFSSWATTLAPGDSNGLIDVFVASNPLWSGLTDGIAVTLGVAESLDALLFGQSGAAGADIEGTAGADTFYMRRSSDQLRIEVYAGDQAQGAPLGVFAVGSPSPILIASGLGDDTLIVDAVNGGISGQAFLLAGGGSNLIRLVGGDTAFEYDLASGSPDISLHLTGGASVHLRASQHLRMIQIDDDSSLLLAAAADFIEATHLLIAPAGRLDLHDGRLTLFPASPPASAYGSVMEYLAAGRNSSPDRWQGHGISSSAAAAATLPMGLVAVMDPAGAFGPSIRVVYTWEGDANADGAIDGDDYFLLDQAFLVQSGGYRVGDHNLDERIDGRDYFILDRAQMLWSEQVSGAALMASSPAWPWRTDPRPIVSVEGPAEDRDDLILGALEDVLGA